MHSTLYLCHRPMRASGKPGASTWNVWTSKLWALLDSPNHSAHGCTLEASWCTSLGLLAAKLEKVWQAIATSRFKSSWLKSRSSNMCCPNTAQTVDFQKILQANVARQSAWSVKPRCPACNIWRQRHPNDFMLISLLISYGFRRVERCETLQGVMMVLAARSLSDLASRSLGV